MVAVASTVSASPAAAFHVNVATYTGTHYAGGSVTLTVGFNGISSFSATDVPGFSCTILSHSESFNYPGPPITNHAFGFSIGSSFGMNGSFPSRQRVQGTFYVQGGCTSRGPDGTPNVPFTATTTASAKDTEECRAATRPVVILGAKASAVQAVIRGIKRQIRKAPTANAKEGFKKSLRKQKRKLAEANRKLQAAEQQQSLVC